MSKLYGFFSQQAAEMVGTSFYSTPDGKEVEVTCADADPEAKGYGWPDKRPVGEVLGWVRHGRAGSSNRGYY